MNATTLMDEKRSEIEVKGVRQVLRPEHPLAPASGLIGVARVVLYDKIGPGPHKCNWCGKRIRWRPGKGPRKNSVCVDHLDWNPVNNDPSNLVPACLNCNASRSASGGRGKIAWDELYVVLPNGNKTRACEQFCEFCGKPFLAAITDVKRGKARFHSHSCRSKAYWRQKRLTDQRESARTTQRRAEAPRQGGRDDIPSSE